MRTYEVSGISIVCLLSIITLLLIDKPRLVSCGSILFYMPFVSKSMKITYMPVAEEMAARGHEVVVLMQHPTKKPNPKLKEIIIDGREIEELTEKVSEQKLKSGDGGRIPIFDMLNTAFLVSYSLYNIIQVKFTVKSRHN